MIVLFPLPMIMTEMEFKHNLPTQILMIKLDILKMVSVVKPYLAF